MVKSSSTESDSLLKLTVFIAGLLSSYKEFIVLLMAHRNNFHAPGFVFGLCRFAFFDGVEDAKFVQPEFPRSDGVSRRIRRAGDRCRSKPALLRCTGVCVSVVPKSFRAGADSHPDADMRLWLISMWNGVISIWK
ncbi:MAG: hypothetical protein DMG15_19755 [Acidobacteria bacterium]|nr:MAG: hypothetical protein DMG16_09610 [Acidobacteriota bacterium]PYS10784.1 MAG: hypothetical protein DMG15_19755 [Acidobacteriota bacterium]